VHAAGESSTGNLADGTYAIALEATCADIAKLAENLAISGVPHKVVVEPDLNNEVVAIGICPDERQKVRRFVSNLPLIK